MKQNRRHLRRFMVVTAIVVVGIFFVNVMAFQWIKAQDFTGIVEAEIASREEFAGIIGTIAASDVRYLGKKKLSWSGGRVTVATDMSIEGSAGRCVAHVQFVREGGSWHVQSMRKKHCTELPDLPLGSEGNVGERSM